MNQLINKSDSICNIIDEHQVLQKLDLIDTLFETLHRSEINYCHWKSSEHLHASMVADTDLDVLFDESQKEHLETILSSLAFKRFAPARHKVYKDIEDYIGLDLPSGKIVHLHTHFRLTMGEVYLKSYQLNLENKILNGRVYDVEYGIYRINCGFELILLLFRAALKLRTRDKLKVLLNRNLFYKDNIADEYQWLKQRCTKAEVELILQSIITDHKPVSELVTGQFNRREMTRLSSLLKKEFKNQRLFSPFHALRLRWYREIIIKLSRKYSTYSKEPVVMQRTNPRGGLVIGIIGADGSGKSTVIENLQATFKKKIDVYKIYFGSGGGQISWYRKLLLSFKRNLPGLKKKPKSNQPEKKEKTSLDRDLVKKEGILAKTFKCMEALMVAREKYNNQKLMQTAKKKGMLVICDRYPQNQIFGYNDGPMLQPYIKSNNPLLKAIAKREAKVYDSFEHNLPDIIFKLVADASIIEARKPGETSLTVLRTKVEGIKQLKFNGSCQVVTINAEEPLEKVLYTIKQKIWEAYN